jgi:glutathione S-transferase
VAACPLKRAPSDSADSRLRTVDVQGLFSRPGRRARALIAMAARPCAAARTQLLRRRARYARRTAVNRPNSCFNMRQSSTRGGRMITLYHRPKTRATRFLFLLEELAAPYQVQIVTTRNRDGSGAADPANPHPHGKVPAISDDGIAVFESPAIALYLTDRFPEKHIGPRVGEAQRGPYLSWLVYYGTVLEPSVMSKFMNIEVPRTTAGWVGIEEVMPALLARLQQGPYLLGESFSAVDVLYGTMFAQFAQSPLLPKSPLIEAYIQRVTGRPAFARALARDAG